MKIQRETWGWSVWRGSVQLAAAVGMELRHVLGRPATQREGRELFFRGCFNC